MLVRKMLASFEHIFVLFEEGRGVERAQECFVKAEREAGRLGAAHPLRLGVAVEWSAFLGDCVRDWGRAREVAGRAVGEVWRDRGGVGEEEFVDAMECECARGRRNRAIPSQGRGE